MSKTFKKINLINGGDIIVDNKDYKFLSQFEWSRKKSHGKKNTNEFHAVRNVRVGNKSLTIRMHRLISEAQPDDRVLFLNGDGLDCRRSNLKRMKMKPWTGRADNSGYHGVKQLASNRWSSEIEVAGKKYIISDEFDDAKKAAISYDITAKRIYGNNATTNF